MKKFGFILLLAVISFTGKAQTARIQFINNCPIPKADSIDIYINNQLVADNLAFRGATAFLEVTSNTGLLVKVVEKNTPNADTPWYTAMFTLDAGKDYIAIAEGLFIFGAESYTPVKDFNLSLYQPAQDSATTTSTVDLMVSHGSTDFTEFDLNEQTIPYYEIVNNINYGGKTPYIQFNPDSLVVEVLITWNFLSYNKYVLDLRPYAGKALSLVASGFLNPLVNNNGPLFGLFLALPEGGPMIELPVWQPIGIDEPGMAKHVSIYPNPAHESLYLSEVDDNQLFDVYSLSGEIIKTGVLLSQKLDISDLPAGFYFIRIKKDGLTYTKSFIKE